MKVKHNIDLVYNSLNSDTQYISRQSASQKFTSRRQLHRNEDAKDRSRRLLVLEGKESQMVATVQTGRD